MNDHFVFDMADHAWAKCRLAIHDALNLADDPTDKAQIAMLILGNAAGLAGGVFAAAQGGACSKEERQKWSLAAIDMAREVVSDGAEAVARRLGLPA